jgi:hypothetical protein
MISKATRERLADERGRALLTILLTNRNDVALVDVSKSPDFGLDFVVAIGNENEEGVRQFGIQLKASAGSNGGKECDRVVLQAIKQGRNRGPFPFPVVLVYVLAETSQMWFAWITKPTNANGQTKLALTENGELQPLNDDTLEGIIRDVHRWYGAFYAASM